MSLRGNQRQTTPLTEDAAYNKLLKALARRWLTVHEAAVKVRAWGMAENAVQTILQRAKQSGYLNDHRFAAEYAAGKFRRGYGWLRIQQELAAHGIARELITETGNACRNDDTAPEQAETLQHTAEKEWRKLTGVEPEARRRRWLGRMQRRGYPAAALTGLLRALERQEPMNVRRIQKGDGE
ncbi:MAG: RecX family transcriptional regulator [bacterium]|nr:RecX family transcriptional regulator [bacterium]